MEEKEKGDGWQQKPGRKQEQKKTRITGDNRRRERKLKRGTCRKREGKDG